MSKWEEERDAEIKAAAPSLQVLVVTSDMSNTPCWAVKEALEAKGFAVARTTVVINGDIQVDLGVLGGWPEEFEPLGTARRQDAQTNHGESELAKLTRKVDREYRLEWQISAATAVNRREQQSLDFDGKDATRQFQAYKQVLEEAQVEGMCHGIRSFDRHRTVSFSDWQEMT